jgi:hypothetical protein
MKLRTHWQRMLSLVGALGMLSAEMNAGMLVAHAQSAPTQAYVSEELACSNAATLLAGGADVRSLAGELNGGQGWVKFNVRQGQRYQVNAGAMRLTLFDSCQNRTVSLPVNQGTISFSAQRSGLLYAKLEPGAGVSSADSHYSLELTDLAAAPPARSAWPKPRQPCTVTRWICWKRIARTLTSPIGKKLD